MRIAINKRRPRDDVDSLRLRRSTTWATSSSRANTAETAAADVNVFAVIRYHVERNTATGARKNSSVSERQNTSMLKAIRQLVVVSN